MGCVGWCLGSLDGVGRRTGPGWAGLGAVGGVEWAGLGWDRGAGGGCGCFARQSSGRGCFAPGACMRSVRCCRSTTEWKLAIRPSVHAVVSRTATDLPQRERDRGTLLPRGSGWVRDREALFRCHLETLCRHQIV